MHVIDGKTTYIRIYTYIHIHVYVFCFSVLIALETIVSISLYIT